MPAKPTTVFVTGANGFVAQHVIKQLVERGDNVVGSVRSAEKGEKLKNFLKGYKGKFSYAIITDFVKEGSCKKAFEDHPDITVVMHIASPVTFTTEDPEKDLLIPAAHGTKSLMSDTKKYAPQVTHFIYTSSAAAVAGMLDFGNPDVTVDESSWNQLTWDEAKANAYNGYFGSKTFGEKAVWDFVKTEKPNFVVNTIIPTFCYGPQAFEAPDPSHHGNVTAQLMALGPDGAIFDIPGCALFVDVRDVAKAHIACFENENIKGERVYTNNTYFNSHQIVDNIRRSFPQLKDTLPVPDLKKPILSLAVNDAKSKKLLGWEFNSLETATIDAVKQILEAKN